MQTQLIPIPSKKSILRYPGGKTRAIPIILPHLERQQATTLISPFFGGGSIEIAWASKSTARKVKASDLYFPLATFWQKTLKSPEEVAQSVEKEHPISKERFNAIKEHIQNNDVDEDELAAFFYVINRSSFSGSTMSGGMSPGHKRFTPSAIQRLREFHAPNIEVAHADAFEVLEALIEESPEGKMIYLDPPYWLSNQASSLYGTKGDMHKDFDHVRLAKLCESLNKKGWKILISYNNDQKVIDEYPNFRVDEVDWKYGMKNVSDETMGESSEILLYSKAFLPEKPPGSISHHIGIVHELTIKQKLGGKLSKDEQEKLDESLSIIGNRGKLVQKIAAINAIDLRIELENLGFSYIDEVIWTAQLSGNDFADLTGLPGISKHNNPSDILIKGKDEKKSKKQIGITLKIATSETTKYPKDVPFFNGGLGKESLRFGLPDLPNSTKGKITDALSKLGIDRRNMTQRQLKDTIRADEDLKSQAGEMGIDILESIRNEMITSLDDKEVKELRELFITMTGTPIDIGEKLPTLKLTGYAYGNHKTKIEDAIESTIPKAIRNAKKFEFKRSARTSLIIVTDGVEIMRMRFKWESQALASSIKTSGESA